MATMMPPTTDKQDPAPSAEIEAPVPVITERGFKHHEAVPSEYGGQVSVYESSAAEGPHIWLRATAPENLNDPEGNEVEAPIHLTLDNATLLRDQLTQLIENHYQVSTPPVGERPGHYPGCTREAGHFGPCEPNALSLPPGQRPGGDA